MPNFFSILIEQIPAYASAIAAICAAYSAYKSWSISKSSFNLQKASIQNGYIITKTNSIIRQLEDLSVIITRNPLELPDDDLKKGDLLFSQIKESLASLRVADGDKSSVPNIDKVSGLVEIYENSMYIDNLIDQLKNYINSKLI